MYQDLGITKHLHVVNDSPPATLILQSVSSCANSLTSMCLSAVLSICSFDNTTGLLSLQTCS